MDWPKATLLYLGPLRIQGDWTLAYLPYYYILFIHEYMYIKVLMND